MNSQDSHVPVKQRVLNLAESATLSKGQIVCFKRFAGAADFQEADDNGNWPSTVPFVRSGLDQPTNLHLKNFRPHLHLQHQSR